MKRPAKVCPHCENLQPCPKHTRKPWARERKRSTLSGSAQQKRARYVLNRDDTVCHVCGHLGANEADHIVPISQGGADTPENMAAIHGPASDPTTCHGIKSQRESRAATGAPCP